MTTKEIDEKSLDSKTENYMTENSIQNPVQDIMHYESDVWAVADLLLAACASSWTACGLAASRRATFRLT